MWLIVLFCLAIAGLSDWGDDDVMAKVIARSQHEYFANLKQISGPSVDGASTSQAASQRDDVTGHS